MNKTLPYTFYAKNTIEVAKNLLGKYLVHTTKEGTTISKIIETEAYTELDKASHSFKGKNSRNQAMFDIPGIAYIYTIYGIYQCFNIVTNKKDIGEAVLVRALEPIKGINIMKKRRNKTKVIDLCSGPAKLVIAMGINKNQNKLTLLKPPLYITYGENIQENRIVNSKRIGISKAKNKKWRFYIKDNKFISKY